MKLPELEEMLPHRGPALMLSAVEEVGERWIRCRADRSGTWYWPELLEASAQAAGLVAAVGLDSPLGGTVVAELRGVAIPDGISVQGPVWFEVTLVSRLLQFHRCRFTVRGIDGAIVVGGDLTLATSTAEPARPADGRRR